MHEYDEIFKKIIQSKKRKPLNEMTVLSLNINSLVSKENSLELHLAVLRAPEITEVIMLQETRGAKTKIPGYTRHDGSFTTTDRWQIHGVTTFTLDLESNDGLKLMTEKLDYVEKFLPKSSQEEKKLLNELSIVVIKVKKIQFNDDEDRNNFSYNDDHRCTLFTNFYAPCCESEFASKADLIFVKVLPAINAHVGSNNLCEFVEHLMCGDSNAPFCKWEERVPHLSFKNHKNSNLVQAFFDQYKNLFQHVKFNTSIGGWNSGCGSSLIDYAITTKKESISNIVNAGHIQEERYHFGLLISLKETERTKRNENLNMFYNRSTSSTAPAHHLPDWTNFNKYLYNRKLRQIPLANIKEKWNFAEIFKLVRVPTSKSPKTLRLTCHYCPKPKYFKNTDSARRHFILYHEQSYTKSKHEQLIENLIIKKWKVFTNHLKITILS